MPLGSTASSWVTKRTLDSRFGITRRRQIFLALASLRDNGQTIGLTADQCADIGEILKYLDDQLGQGVDMGLALSQQYADTLAQLPDLNRSGHTVVTTDERDTLKALGVVAEPPAAPESKVYITVIVDGQPTQQEV